MRTGDYIVAVVNQELVTAGEVERRSSAARTPRAARAAARGAVEAQVLDALIDDRAQLIARARAARVDDAELDRAVNNVAVQNQITMAQLRERLRKEGIDYARFRNNVRDQMLTERVREREEVQRIRVTDAEIDRWSTSAPPRRPTPS